MLNIFWFYYENFKSPIVYLACHWLKNKIYPTFNLLAIYFVSCDIYLNFDVYV